ncbi:MAG: PepSY-associated TM helix domain-containing protein [Rubrivivax sp.]
MSAVLPEGGVWSRWRRRHHQALLARRKLWLQVHLWLGLVLGGVPALVGLTGAVLVFHAEIDHAINPAFFRATPPPGAQRVPLQRLREVARQEAPANWESGTLILPDDAEGNVVAAYWLEAGTPAPEEAVSLNLALDPYSGRVVGRRTFYHRWNPLKHCFTGFFFKLHYALLLGEFGTTLVGVLGVFFVLSALTGLVLWWPLDGKWKRVLGIKRGASPVRLNHDLHQAFGFWSSVVLLAVLVSGLYFNLPEQFRWIVERFSPLAPEPEAAAVAGPPMDLDSLLTGASTGALNYVSLPDPKTGLTEACWRDVPELRPRVVDNRCVTFDSAGGRALKVADTRSGSGGDTFMLWQWPLHSGSAFGWTGRILVMLSGLACPLLFVTGVIRWLHKRRAQRMRRAR